uniref:Uncharacterized protein n=1 Tax=Arundo donax TaxID=35708 RepID=A0A0A8YHD1_ARUDO
MSISVNNQSGRICEKTTSVGHQPFFPFHFF